MLTVDTSTRLEEINGFLKRMNPPLRLVRHKAGIEGLHEIHLFLVHSEIGGEVAYTASSHALHFIETMKAQLAEFARSVEERLYVISMLAQNVNGMILQIHRADLLRKL